MMEEFQARSRTLRDIKNRQPVEIIYMLPTDDEILTALQKKETALTALLKSANEEN